MAENRRRNRNRKRDDNRHNINNNNPTTPVTIARREDARCGLGVMQPKILLKKETESSSGSSEAQPPWIKTIVVNRSDARNSSERHHSSGQSLPNTSSSVNSAVCAALTPPAAAAVKDKRNGTTVAGAAGQDSQLLPPRMTRPLMLGSGICSVGVRKMFHKTNTDFTVIGVLGGLSVGKSTLLNLLSAERASDYDYYGHLIAPTADECTFATRHCSNRHQQQSQSSQANSKNSTVLHSRTERMHFFITRERYILLDTPPIVAAANKESSDCYDLQAVSTMMLLLSVCHVLLVAVDELSLEQLRLLHSALRLRPRVPFTDYAPNYLPQVMFVRTRAQRRHFELSARTAWDRQLSLLFQTTGLPMHRGRGEGRCINSFLFPEITPGNADTAHHPNIFEVTRQFRERVFSMTRLPMCHTNDFTELIWFDLLTETSWKCTLAGLQFDKIFAKIKQRHLEMRSKKRTESNTETPHGHS